MYLAFVSQDSLPADFRRALAVDISLAALLGEDVYNFGELLLHPIVSRACLLGGRSTAGLGGVQGVAVWLRPAAAEATISQLPANDHPPPCRLPPTPPDQRAQGGRLWLAARDAGVLQLGWVSPAWVGGQHFSSFSWVMCCCGAAGRPSMPPC